MQRSMPPSQKFRSAGTPVQVFDHHHVEIHLSHVLNVNMQESLPHAMESLPEHALLS